MKPTLTLTLMALSLMLGYILNGYVHSAQYEQAVQDLSLQKAALNKAATLELTDLAQSRQNLNSRLGILASCIQGESFLSSDARTINCQTFTSLLAQGKVKF